MAEQLEGKGVGFTYEALSLNYQPKTKRYVPDYVLDNGIILEVKGRFDSSDRAKHLLVKAQHPEADIRFVFGNASNKLGNKSETTYAMWADKHGFQWCEKEIPDEWLKPSTK